jgi:hypothetical protein
MTNSTRTKIMKWSFVVVLAAGAVMGIREMAAQTTDGQHLDGSWVTRNHVPGEEPFSSVVTLHTDGTLEESVQPSTNPLVSDAHGVWTRIGNRTFAITVVYLRANAAGVFQGVTKVRAIFTLDPALNTGTGRFHADAFDPSGNLLFSFEGTSDATRIRVELPPF